MEHKNTIKPDVSKKLSAGNWLISLWDKSKSHFLIGAIFLTAPVLYFTIIKNTNREIIAKDERVKLVERRSDIKDSVNAAIHIYYQNIIYKKDSIHNEQLKELIYEQQKLKNKIEKL